MKKISLIVLPILILLFFFEANSSFAQTPSAQIRNLDEVTKEYETSQSTKSSNSKSPIDLGLNSGVPENLTTYTQSIFIEITSAASCLLAGVDPIRPDLPCLGYDPTTNKLGYVENSDGAIGMMGGLIAMTYEIPASSGDYFIYLASNFGITRSAVAAPVSDDFCTDNPSLCSGENESSSLGFGTGGGFESLTPLLGIWTAMRNLVYLLFVLIFIILGLGIMFRIQIDPRAVLSIQNQLPKVIIALILVTFSYAIAGFLIDMMNLSLFLIINIFQSQGLKVSTTLATNPVNAVDGLDGINNIAANASQGITAAIGSLFDGSTFGSVFKGILNFLVDPVGTITKAAGSAFGFSIPGAGFVKDSISSVVSYALDKTGIGVSNPFALVVGAIAWLIIIIALFSALLRLWFTLLKTYVFILIDITFAPIWIAFGLIPGSSLTFGNWIRSLVSNLAAFPIVLVLFSLGKTLQQGFLEAGPKSFVPPYIGDPGDMSIFASLIGMGMILLAPEAVNIAKAALKSPEFKIASAAFRPLGVGQGVLGKGVGSVKNALWYTNPHTGEAGRLKSWAGEKASGTIQKTPGIGDAYRGIKNVFTPASKKNAAREAAARDAAQRERDETSRRTAEALERMTAPPAPESTPEEPEPESRA